MECNCLRDFAGLGILLAIRSTIRGWFADCGLQCKVDRGELEVEAWRLRLEGEGFKVEVWPCFLPPRGALCTSSRNNCSTRIVVIVIVVIVVIAIETVIIETTVTPHFSYRNAHVYVADSICPCTSAHVDFGDSILPCKSAHV